MLDAMSDGEIADDLARSALLPVGQTTITDRQHLLREIKPFGGTALPRRFRRRRGAEARLREVEVAALMACLVWRESIQP